MSHPPTGPARGGESVRIRERALRRAYGRIYEGLRWEDASEVGREEADLALTADDVLDVIETDEALNATADPKPECFADLPENWDSYGASAIDPRAITSARRFLDSLFVYPTSDGGVGLAWLNEAVDIAFDAEGRVTEVMADLGEAHRRLKVEPFGGTAPGGDAS